MNFHEQSNSLCVLILFNSIPFIFHQNNKHIKNKSFAVPGPLVSPAVVVCG